MASPQTQPLQPSAEAKTENPLPPIIIMAMTLYLDRKFRELDKEMRGQHEGIVGHIASLREEVVVVLKEAQEAKIASQSPSASAPEGTGSGTEQPQIDPDPVAAGLAGWRAWRDQHLLLTKRQKRMHI